MAKTEQVAQASALIRVVKESQMPPRDLPLDALVPLWHHPLTMSETENQFFLTRAAPMNRRRGEKPVPAN
jgi:hypothetical protein